MDCLTHITSDGERWDSLAWRYYGSVYEAQRIMEANPDVPLTPLLPSGIRLAIPVVEEADVDETTSLPPWCAGGGV